MKKTVQIVTIPLNKSGKLAKKDTSDKYELAEGETVFVNGFGYTPQQLLVLSNDGIFPKDNLYGDGKLVVANNEWSGETNIEWKKVIASYPHIEGTLPMSKETVQAWIDSGTPGEGSVDFELVRPCDLRDDQPEKEDKILTYFRIGSQGNLLLEFGNPIDRNYPEEYELTQDDAKEWVNSSNTSIPTDEEIREKGKEFVEKYQKDMNAATNDKWSMYGSRMDVLASFYQGYKQALKDLGHE
jgi:hypothetical protein